MSESTKEIRCFIGIPVPPDLATELNKRARVWREENRFPDFKWVKKTDYHLTLHFLGEQPLGLVQKLIKLLREKQLCKDISPPESPTGIRIQGFPDAAHAKFIAAELAELPGLSLLHEYIGRVLESEGLTTDAQAFRPHISLARLKPKHTPPPIPVLETLQSRFPIGEYAVFKSILTPEGSHYEVLERIS